MCLFVNKTNHLRRLHADNGLNFISIRTLNQNIQGKVFQQESKLKVSRSSTQFHDLQIPT